MFRRKEETNDSSIPGAMQTDEQLNDSAAPSAPTVSAAAPVASSTYVPTAPAARPAAASEPARSAAPAASTYRPTPIAEFNRGAARTTSDVRPASSAPAASSFSSIGEKTSAGKSNRRVLTVGNDILLKGEIATCDRLVIEGRVEAKLSEVHTVEIAEVGSFKGTAEVEDAEVSGLFEGDLIVRNRLVIYASGEVRGNITYGEIEIERGGRMTGQIKTVAAGSKGSKNAFESPDKVRAATKETVAA